MKKIPFLTALITILFVGANKCFANIISMCDCPSYNLETSNKYLFLYNTDFKRDFYVFLFGLILLIVSIVGCSLKSLFKKNWSKYTLLIIDIVYLAVSGYFYVKSLYPSVVPSCDCGDIPVNIYKFPWVLGYVESYWNVILAVVLLIISVLIYKFKSDENTYNGAVRDDPTVV